MSGSLEKMKKELYIYGRSNEDQCGQTFKNASGFPSRDSNSIQKVWLVTSQPLGQVCPLIYNVHQIYIKSNSSYKHNFKKNV